MLGGVLLPGDPLPHFGQRSQSKPVFGVDTMAGRYLVLCFYASAHDPLSSAAIDASLRHRDRFDDQRACFFGISADPRDAADPRIFDRMPGIRFLLDFDKSVSQLCGALPQGQAGGPEIYRRFWLLVDPTLHVLAKFPFSTADPEHRAVFAALDRLPGPDSFAPFELPPPVLVLPNVFEPLFSQRLIEAYDAHGGGESGVMRNGAGVHDHSFKRRKDYMLTEPDLLRGSQLRIRRRVVPEVWRLFSMRITRIERYIVGCYAAEEGGHFMPHRDNNGDITAHRRFAVSINLNEDFDGGELRFPEYSRRKYKAPPGWAIVFPGNILHAVSEVTRGRRYAFLPFIYDEAGQQIREAYFLGQRQADDDGRASAGAVEG